MTKITCDQRDTILLAEGLYVGWSVAESLTDPSGQFGAPRIETTWIKDGRRIKDVRHPSEHGGDTAPCEHYELEGSSDD